MNSSSFWSVACKLAISLASASVSMTNILHTITLRVLEGSPKVVYQPARHMYTCARQLVTLCT